MNENRDWRQRRRLAAVEEIKQAARKQISENGAVNLSLGAIARSLGMTPPALYRYFDSRDALVTALIIDAYASMGEVMAQAAKDIPNEQYSHKVLALLQADRRWAVEYSEDYALMYGLSTADVEMSQEQEVAFQHAVLRSMRAMVVVLQAANQAGDLIIPARYTQPPPGFKSALLWMQLTLEDHTFPLPILAIALTTWLWADGFVWQELHGHLPQLLYGDGDFYDMECRILMERLGLFSGG